MNVLEWNADIAPTGHRSPSSARLRQRLLIAAPFARYQ
jgi:hypothetical protein